MAILRDLRYRPVPDWGEPFSNRPNSLLALAADPGRGDGQVRSLGLIFEIIAPGDVGAIHSHPVDEAIFLEEGQLEIQIGDQVDMIGPADVAFVPRNTPHGWRNPGPGTTRFRAVFPTDVIGMRFIEPRAERPDQPSTADDLSQIHIRALLDSQ